MFHVSEFLLSQKSSATYLEIIYTLQDHGIAKEMKKNITKMISLFNGPQN
jgi:hypothetical protein